MLSSDHKNNNVFWVFFFWGGGGGWLAKASVGMAARQDQPLALGITPTYAAETSLYEWNVFNSMQPTNNLTQLPTPKTL
mgnify:CR=1 FL=1